jgi:hypothetical protein
MPNISLGSPLACMQGLGSLGTVCQLKAYGTTHVILNPTVMHSCRLESE